MKVTHEQLAKRIARLDAIPTIPTIIRPLMAMLQQPTERVRLKDVEKLVALDGAIAVQCLKMANSPLFGRTALGDCFQFDQLVGGKRVESILLGLSLNRAVPPEKWAIDPLAFWRHSLGCALVTRRLAEMISYPDAEKAYLAGLLHDLGIIVSSLVCTTEFRGCLKQAAKEQSALAGVETRMLGFTHCETGEILARQWNLPQDLCQVIQFHHNVDAQSQDLVCLVHLSDLLCRVRNLNHGYVEVLSVDFFEDPAWTVLAQSYPFCRTWT